MTERIVTDFVPAFERVQAGLEQLYEGVLFGDGAEKSVERVSEEQV